jgi:hypothetical protein
MDLPTFNYVLRLMTVVLDVILTGLLIYEATLAEGPIDKRKVIGFAVSVIILTATMAYLALHPPSASNAYGARQSRVAAGSN